MLVYRLSAPCLVPFSRRTFVYTPSFKLAALEAMELPLEDRKLSRIEAIAIGAHRSELVDLMNGEPPRHVGRVLRLWLFDERGRAVHVPSLH